ncbi:hypothetical protein VCSRO154_3269 [Vibrio metoecus]|nr:hypothetical protein VCSRO154_3269 [Vibrio metoecus]
MSNAGVVEKFVYENIIDNRKAVRGMRKFEEMTRKHSAKITKLFEDTEKSKQRAIKNTEKEEVKAATKKLTAEQKAAAQAEKLKAQEAAKLKKFNDWKLAQFRSAAFERLSLEQKMELKRVLSAKRSEEEIREEYRQTTAMMRRENQRRAAYERKQSKINNSGVKGGLTAGATGGGIVALAGNPAALAAAAVIGGGAMAINSGSQQFRDTKEGANLVGLDYNEFAQLANGLIAVTETIPDVSTAADKIKDLLDRSGEVMAETVFDSDKGEFDKGEGSILANLLLKQGVITGDKESLNNFMNQSPDKFIESVVKATEGLDAKQQAFVLEAFGSDFYNIVRGIQTNRQGFEAGKQNAVQFNTAEMTAATEFNKSVASMVSAISNADLNIFKSFTEFLSPSSLAMFGKLGELLNSIATLLGYTLSGALNLLSPAINLVLDGLNLLLGGLTNVQRYITELTKYVSDGLTIATEWIKNSLRGMLHDILNVLPDFAKKALGISTVEQTPTTPTTTTAPTTPKPYNMTSPTTYGGYSGYGTQNPTTTTNPTNTTATVNLVVDGNTLATAVVNSAVGQEGVKQIMHRSRPY